MPQHGVMGSHRQATVSKISLSQAAARHYSGCQLHEENYPIGEAKSDTFECRTFLRHNSDAVEKEIEMHKFICEDGQIFTTC